MDSDTSARAYDQLHRISIRWDCTPDPEVDQLLRDLVCVESAVHQSMVIVGPWFEARVARLIKDCLPEGWTTSGPAQIYDPAKPGVRSRSWDIVVHRKGLDGLPPEAYPGSGYALLPKSSVAAVIDTKTSFSAPKTYAAQTLFNLMNDSIEPQFALLGSEIHKIVFAARSNRSPESLARQGAEVGLEVYSLAKITSGPVSQGADRETVCIPASLNGAPSAIELLRRSILRAIDALGCGVEP